MADNRSKKINPRERIAKIISISVPVATGVMAVIAIVFAILLFQKDGEADNAIDVLKYTFTALLPLWGTWIGTVLAYYFSKENFESANKSVKDLVSHVTSVSEKLQSIKVKDVWISYDEMIKKEFTTDSDLKNYKVNDAIQFLDKRNRNRLPVLLTKTLVYIIHLSTFDRYIRIQSVNKTDYTNHTIDNMLNCGDEKVVNSLKMGAGFVSENSNLLEAKKIMDANTYCNDVFVTKNGYQGEEIMGWISDKIINENAKV